mgnify:CR=1 FL=1
MLDKYYIDNNKPEKALPFVDDLFKLDIKDQTNNQKKIYERKISNSY